MDWCQVEMGEERGAEMRALFERLLGHPCPCYGGGTCPLLPDAERAPLAEALTSGY